MKTTSLILIGFMSLLSRTGFANSIDQSEVCCPVATETTSLYHQQLLLDQIQSESEAITVHQVNPIHDIVNKKISERTVTEITSQDQMQRESETVTMEPLHHLSNKVAQQLESRVSLVVR